MAFRVVHVAQVELVDGDEGELTAVRLHQLDEAALDVVEDRLTLLVDVVGDVRGERLAYRLTERRAHIGDVQLLRGHRARLFLRGSVGATDFRIASTALSSAQFAE
jgi:hypothetical protein